MPVIKHSELKKNLKTFAADDAPGVVLIHGEELLVKTSLEMLVDLLLPGDSRQLNYEPVDGDEAAVATAVEKVNTYSLMTEPKVVAVVDAQLFYSRQDTTRVIERARKAFKDNKMRQAAQALLKVMALLGVSFEELTPESRAEALKLTGEQRREEGWLSALLDYCREHDMQVPTGGSAADMLEQAIIRGFPPRQFLVITTDIVDRRRSLYKTIAEKGLVIDCAVPKGNRRADQTAQTAVLNEQLARVLKECGKKMEPEARALLGEMAGFNLRAVTNSVRQLASYIGARDTITAEDVRQVVRKTSQDPIFNFTNAITARDRTAALVSLNSLLADNLYPLQLLAAMVNQVRKLIHIRGFMESSAGAAWRSGCPFNTFKARVMPVIVDFDRGLGEEISAWETALKPAAGAGKGAKKKTIGKVVADLLIARNPKNPYPVYQLFKKAERFSLAELYVCLELLEKADQQLKSTAMDPRLVLENVVMAMCPI